MKINAWKLTSIILILTILSISFILYNQKTEIYDFGEIQIKKSQLDAITIPIKFGESFILCEISNSKCVNLQKLGD